MTVARRDVLVAGAAAGAGLVLGFVFGDRRARSSGERATTDFSPNAFVRIGGDDTVTVIVTKHEMGQGVRTALPMILAEELDADWRTIRVEQAEADEALYGDEGTGGSSSVIELYDPLRRAGAAAREMLVAAAARRWGVLAGACRTESGAVIHDASGRRARYGELASLAATLPVPGRPELKDPKDFRLIGTRTPRLDTPGKTDGSAQYGLDVVVPGMRYAALARSPVFGGRATKVDGARALAVPGVVRVLEIDGAAAVVATSTWSAMQGKRALDVTWDEGPHASIDSASIRRAFADGLRDAQAWRFFEKGDLEGALADAGVRRATATYDVPFLAQAPMEPMNFTASYTPGACETWGPTQRSSKSFQRAIGRAVGLEPDQVKVHATLLGGGFGRRLQDDYAVEAAKISKAIGAPVKVTWTREDEMRGGFYRQAALHDLAGAIDAAGDVIAFRHTIVAPTLDDDPPKGPGPAENETVAEESPFFYAVPNARLEYVLVQTPVPIGPYRSVYASHIAFASEHFLDELARLGGADPLELRLRLLREDRTVDVPGASYATARLRGVLQLAAEEAGWGKPAEGRARGVACWGSFRSYVAQVAEVSVDAGKLRVHRVVCAVDCGQPINPSIIEAQMQSAIVFGLSAALDGAITIRGGRAEQSNFDDYPVLRIDECPDIEVHVVPSKARVSGIGEPGVPPIAPAVANAVLAATGKPVRQLPMRAGTRS